MANEIEQALYSKLTGDGTLTGMLATATSVYDSLAPQGADCPYIVISLASEVDQDRWGGRAYERRNYLIKAVTAGGSGAQGGTIADRVDVLLADQPLTVSGHTHMATRRTSLVSYPEVVSGDVYRHRGGYYEIVTSP